MATPTRQDTINRLIAEITDLKRKLKQQYKRAKAAEDALASLKSAFNGTERIRLHAIADRDHYKQLAKRMTILSENIAQIANNR